jgi:DNA-directed RNA polymerase alpha subunit
MYHVNVYYGTAETIASCKDLELAKNCAEWHRYQGRKHKSTIPMIIIHDDFGEMMAKYPEDQCIEDMDLSVRSYNCLKRADITWLSELKAMTINDIASIRNLGPRCTAEILTKIADLTKGE